MNKTLHPNYPLKTKLKKDLSKKAASNTLRWYQLSLLVILIDQLTKHIATYRLTPYEPHPITPFFNLMLAYNQGAAFSFLSQQPIVAFWLFTGIALAMSTLIALWLYRMPSNQFWVYPCALALVLGGALGNVIDRLLYRFVIDFLQF